MSEQEAPYISPELIEWLDKIFPERSPAPHESPSELMVRAGEAKVVRKLRATFESQQPD